MIDDLETMKRNPKTEKAEQVPNVPLAEKVALSYEEVEALGICTARSLRAFVADGRVKRSVLRPARGKRIRFLRTVLIEELQQKRK